MYMQCMLQLPAWKHSTINWSIRRKKNMLWQATHAGNHRQRTPLKASVGLPPMTCTYNTRKQVPRSRCKPLTPARQNRLS